MKYDEKVEKTGVAGEVKPVNGENVDANGNVVKETERKVDANGVITGATLPTADGTTTPKVA